MAMNETDDPEEIEKVYRAAADAAGTSGVMVVSFELPEECEAVWELAMSAFAKALSHLALVGKERSAIAIAGQKEIHAVGRVATTTVAAVACQLIVDRAPLNPFQLTVFPLGQDYDDAFDALLVAMHEQLDAKVKRSVDPECN